MARNHQIVFIVCVLLVCAHQSTSANLGCLNINLNKVCRKQENLRNEVEDIWAVIATSGIQKQDYGNKIRTDDLGINAQELISKVNGTLTTFQGLKTEVEHLIVSSRNGLKHEKSWQREAIRNITKVCDDFQTGMTYENDDLKQSIRDMQENNQQKLNNIETENWELRNIIAEVQNDYKKLPGMTKENDDLKQTIRDMQENNQQELNNVKTENRELRTIIVGVQKDYQKMRSDFEAETKTLKQTVHEMQNDNEQIRTELSKLQASTTTTPLPTTTTTTTTIPILCDGDWESFDDHCYLFVSQYKSWDDASAYCSSKNSYLVEITTDTEREFVSDLVRDYPAGWFWIGATDRDTTGWFIYYHSKLPIPEKYWYKGQPDNSGGNQHCVTMRSYTRRGVVELYDYSCNLRTWFVCETHMVCV